MLSKDKNILCQFFFTYFFFLKDLNTIAELRKNKIRFYTELKPI